MAWWTYPRNETLVHQQSTLPSPATPPSPLTTTSEAIYPLTWRHMFNITTYSTLRGRIKSTGRHCISDTCTPEAIICTGVHVYPFDLWYSALLLNHDNARQLHKSQLYITQSKTVLNMYQTTYSLSYKLKYYSSQKPRKLSNFCSLSMFSLSCGLVVWFTGPW